MAIINRIGTDKSTNNQPAVRLIAFLVAASGLYVIAASLIEQLRAHRHAHFGALFYDLPLLLGLGAVYLSTLLIRRKRTAWLVAVGGYSFYLVLGIVQILSRLSNEHLIGLRGFIRLIVLPLIILALLWAYHKDYVVKSDIQGFGVAVRFVVLVLLVTLAYGTIGFELMDTRDFHQEISLPSALHYTVDQFNITTNKPAHPYTERAKLFVDSLSVISLAALVYAALSLFQPLRARLADQSLARDHIAMLLDHYHSPSEEFFKLWPHDKQYFFDDSGEAGLAFHTNRGVALCLSDPVGNPTKFKSLLEGFNSLCFNNDWLPALIHVSPPNIKLYEQAGYSLQKIGQEAVTDVNHFQSEVKDNKYFRQINNKFTKQGYSHELLSPPHHDAILDRLKIVSDEWLSRGSRAERGFVMGYFSRQYMQLCQIMVARDAAETIQAFVSLVPATFNKDEATYDLLRHGKKALTNVTDYLLINLIESLQNGGYKRLNLGLAPLAGMSDEQAEEQGILDNVMKFAYANGDRFYSFSGLYRFKNKYEPDWQDRFIAYKGGLRGFTKTITSLTRLMSKVVKL